MATETVKELHTLYNGEISINFYPNSHKYKREGEKTWLLSVSAISGIVDKPYLKQWAVNCAIENLVQTYKDFGGEEYQEGQIIDPECLENVRKNWEPTEAKDTGTNVHTYIEAFIGHKLFGTPKPEVPTTDMVLKSVSAFLKWNAEHAITYLHSEKLVYSKKFDYVGIFDVMFELEGKRILGDFKTSKKISADYIAQCIGYVIAYEEEFGECVDGIAVLRFDKESGEFQTFYVYKGTPEWDKGVEQFKACLTLKRTNSEFEKLIEAANAD